MPGMRRIALAGLEPAYHAGVDPFFDEFANPATMASDPPLTRFQRMWPALFLASLPISAVPILLAINGSVSVQLGFMLSVGLGCLPIMLALAPCIITGPYQQGTCCIMCGYDMAGLPEGRCPECGTALEGRQLASLAEAPAIIER